MASLARRAASLGRLSLSTPKTSVQAPNLIHRRNLSGPADPNAPPRVNIWEDPMSPSRWKEEHFVIVSLSGWGLLIYGGYKLFSGGKKEEKSAEAPK